MNKTKIDWADSTWNPVTGCLHGCEYCYARKVAERFKGGGYGREAPFFIGKYKDDAFSPPYVLDAEQLALTKHWYRNAPYPFGFEPTFHRYRLNEYKNKKGRNIFVCSMADLFGDWVPDEWIQEVFKACEAAPQHRYMFLTKNPKRYEKVLDHFFPPNMWFGWSQDGPMGNAMLHSTHQSIQSFVSIEPLRRPFESFDVRGVDWAIVGAETGSQRNKVVPEKAWVDAIVAACKEASVPLFMKSSLRGLMGDDFIQEFPWTDPGTGHN